jgi:hypothetical protein
MDVWLAIRVMARHLLTFRIELKTIQVRQDLSAFCMHFFHGKTSKLETMVFLAFLLLLSGFTDAASWHSALQRELQNTGVWTQTVTNVTLTGASKLGLRVGLSGDGSTILTSGSNQGGVVYNIVSGSWAQNGTAILGTFLKGIESTLNSFGVRKEREASLSSHNLTLSSFNSNASGSTLGIDVDISADGSTIALAQGISDAGGQNAGGVKLFGYNSTLGDWIQKGSDLIGAVGSKENTTVALSDDGNIVAVGWPGKGTGQTEVFSYSATGWSKLGNTIQAAISDTWLGTDISIDAAGTLVAFGAPQDPTNGISSGLTGVYEKAGTATSWTSLNPIQSSVTGELYGTSTALCADGSMVAFGAPGANSMMGRVAIYNVVDMALIGTLTGSNVNDQFGTYLWLPRGFYYVAPHRLPFK